MVCTTLKMDSRLRGMTGNVLWIMATAISRQAVYLVKRSKECGEWGQHGLQLKTAGVLLWGALYRLL